MKNQKMKKPFVTVLLVAFLTSIISVIPVQASPVGLVADWKLDEGTGSKAYDETTNNNDGVLSGGKFGNALYFDGVNSYVEVPDTSSLDITGDITIEAWILIKGFSTSEGLHMYIVGKDSAAGRSYGIGVDLTWINPKKPFVVVFHPGGGYQIAWGNTILSTGIWYHIAGVFDTVNDKLTLYVNGALQTPASDTSTIYSSTSNLRIGARQYTGAQCFFNGIIDEVRISSVARYTSAFTPSSNAFTPDANTAGLWHFDESVGTIASDSSGNGNHGTISNAKWAGPTWVQGRTGASNDYALEFDGVDDFVRVSDSSSIAPSSITVDAWVKRSGTPGTYKYIISKYYIQKAGSWSSYAFYTGSTGGLYFYVGDATSYRLSPNAGTAVWDGNWHHITGTFDDASNTLKLYVDGILVSGSTGGTGESIGYDAGDLFIGTYRFPDGSWCFSGTIDEVRVWNVAFTSSTVWNLQFNSDSESIVQVGTTATLKAFLTADNEPVDGVTVEFSSAPAGLTINPSEQQTDTNGIATVTANGPAGVYTITATVETPFCTTISAEWTLVIFDPKGMAAGGGWYITESDTDPETYGVVSGARATFGFVAKYIKGVASGNLEFQYHIEEKLNLKSTSITWLVVSGSNAQFKGTATLNGESGHYFRVIAQDKGEPGVGQDTFSIKIWLGDPDNGGTLIHSSHNVLAGGNIMVKTK